jgi:N-acetylneuraminic acid mutarotase
MSIRNSARKVFSTTSLCIFCGFLTACGGGGSHSSTPPPVPVIQNLNNSTLPSSPVSLPIEINGTGFQGAPGAVIFTQGSITATVTPSGGGWSDTGIVAVVPAGNGSTQFTLPGTVSVAVKTTGGTSNSIDLTLVATVNFQVNNVTWTTTTPLPAPVAGLRAVAVPATSKSGAFVVVTGGFDGTKNDTTVLSNSIAPDGTLGANWSAIATNPLPASRAYHAMVEADPGNSLVPVGSRFIYVIGGQEKSTDTPGGTSTVFMAPVDPSTGAVGTWTQLASSLPVPLAGPGATLVNGYVYVVGGLQQSSEPSPGVYSAKVNSDGTLGAWTKSGNSYPSNVAFPTVLGFAGNLYVINGDDQNETALNLADTGGVTNVNFAPAHFGDVGAWVSTNQSIKDRSKQVTWLAFGQIIDAEGTYNGTPSCCELERTTVNADSTLASWNSITNSVNEPGANVYSAAGIVSPLLSPTNAPRFLLFGGQQFVTSGAGYPTNPLSAKVYVNNAP